MREVICQKVDGASECIIKLVGLYGKTVNKRHVDKVIDSNKNGTSGLGIIRVAEKLGFDCRGVVSEDKKLPEENIYPFIVYFSEEFSTRYGIILSCNHKSNSVEIFIPNKGTVRFSLEKLTEFWTGLFFILDVTDRFEKLGEDGSGIWAFFPLLYTHKNIFIKAFVASIMLSIFGIITAFYFRFLIDEVLHAGLDLTLHSFSIGLLCVICFQSLLMFARNQLLLFLGYKIDVTLTLSYFKHLLRLPMRFFSKRKTGTIISRVYDSSQIRSLISSTALSVLMDCVMIILGGMFLFFVSSKLLLISIASVISGAIVVFLFLKPYRRKMMQRAIAEAEKQSNIVEVVNGIETIKSCSAEDYAFDKIEFSFINAIKKSMSIQSMNNLESAIQNIINRLGMLAVYWIGGLSILHGSMSLGQLISFVILSNYVVGPLFRLLTLQPSIQEAQTAADRLLEVFAEPIEDHLKKNTLNCSNLRGNIDFNNVSFSYDSHHKILDNVNIHITAGSSVAFVGESGSGKSTAGKLLSGFYNVDDGEILVDNQNISDYSAYDFRKSIGYVPQNILLFSGTISENIALGNDNVSMEKILQSSILAQADKFIRRLPNRYDTIIGEKGDSLSGGERQRIAISRAILNTPPIMILDEATSGLDNNTEEFVMQNLNMLYKDKTIVMISHKISSIKNCDQIFVFDDGKIIENGNHLELLQLRGKYYNLWKIQNEGVAA